MKKLRYILVLFAVIALGAGLLTKRSEVVEAVAVGLSVCGEILIPSLFPFMVLSSFALGSGVFAKTSRPITFIMNKLFKLPGVCFSVIFFGFIGGYPVGGRMIAELYDNGVIDRNQARRLFSFCVNAGPAFIVTAAGGMMIGSQKAGYVMLVSALAASLITGIVYSLVSGKDVKPQKSVFMNHQSLSDALISSVVSSSGGMISVCAWVLVFSALAGLIEPLMASETAGLLFDALSEVTSGVTAAVKIGGIPFAAAAISFGGVCVMCQLIPSMKKCGVKVYEYVLFRIINSVLTYIITWGILRFADVSVSVSTLTGAELWSHSAPSSAALLMMCAVLILEVGSKSKFYKFHA